MAIRSGLRGGVSLSGFAIAPGAFALPHVAPAQGGRIDQTPDDSFGDLLARLPGLERRAQ